MILEVIQNHPRISRKELAIAVGASPKTIARDIEGIRKHLRLEFVGGKTTGHWEIIIS